MPYMYNVRYIKRATTRSIYIRIRKQYGAGGPLLVNALSSVRPIDVRVLSVRPVVCA